MSLIEPEDILEVATVEDDSCFREFIATDSTGILMVSEACAEGQQALLPSDTGGFAKWIRNHDPDISVRVDKSDGLLDQRSGDLWLPLVFLATNVALPMYLNLVASYLYDRMKGALRGDVARVHLSVEYEDKTTGTVKRLRFEGDVYALEKAIKQFDMNRFLDE